MKVIVVKGVIDIPDTGPAVLAEQWRLGGFGARNATHFRRYWPGETVNLSAGEAQRLVAAGVVEIVP